jgi:apolipoprotein N-acyltransferase
MAPSKSSRIWLVVGALLLGLSQMRWGVGALAWVAPIPFLVYLRATRGARSRLLAALGIFAGYTLAVAKIVTAPLPLAFAPLFALPTSALATGAYLAWDRAQRRSPAWVPPLVFAAASVVTEFAQHRLTPFASWGAVAYTQVDDLPLLQVSSLLGMAGVSFLVSWVASALESFWEGPVAARRQLAVAVVSAAAAHGFGTLRLGLAEPGETVAVAAVGTDATFGGFPHPSADEMERVNQGLFARTARAAAAGARLVAWTEAATLVLPEDEAAFVTRLGAAAAGHRVELVAAYIVPDDAARTYRNKYVWVRPDGTVDHTSSKHHPVPGEPTSPGTELPRVVETAAGRAAGAICYDYDFPALALQQARLGLDLSVVPSSDWRGIDPIHTQMASVRAIEGGFSLLRSTRFGLTGAFDPYGRSRAWESSFDSRERVVLTALPRRGVKTLYVAVGDTWVALCAAITAAALVAPWVRRTGAGPAAPPRTRARVGTRPRPGP